MIALNWKPQKGKAFEKLPKKTMEIFDDQIYYVSTKYDGNQIFITKHQDVVRFFTSDWKEFDLPWIGNYLATKTLGDYILVGECLYDSNGKKGARTKVQGKLTTERVNFSKGLKCTLDEDKITVMVFDFIEFDDRGTIEHRIARDRFQTLKHLSIYFPYQLRPVQQLVATGAEATNYTKGLVKDGWEGTMLVEPDSYYHLGKRVNHVIKLKYRPTADLMCTGFVEGTGKYTGMIGSLILEDSEGRVVKVGSGLNDNQRQMHPLEFVNKVIEIEYEQLMDTYQQPTFVCVREDKTKGE